MVGVPQAVLAGTNHHGGVADGSGKRMWCGITPLRPNAQLFLL